jgi:hypothetical protein
MLTFAFIPVRLGYSVCVRLPSFSHLIVFLTFSLPTVFSITKLEPLLLRILVMFWVFLKLLEYVQVVLAVDGEYGLSQAAQALELRAVMVAINKIGFISLR